MKKILVIAFLAVIFLGLFIFVQNRSAVNQGDDFAQAKEVSFFEIADSANMVLVASVGLGNQERRKVVSGRLYRNFVQLLKTNGAMNINDTLSVNCKEGARLDFYRDTILLGEYRLAGHFIGKENEQGFWVGRRIKKVEKFLKDQGAQFVPCGEDSLKQESEFAVLPEQSRPLFTVPKFGAHRKGNASRNDAQDSIMKGVMETSKVDLDSAEKTVRQTMRMWSGFIFSQDTALGIPLPEQIKSTNRAEVLFFENQKEIARKVLTSAQLEEMKGLYAKPRVETFIENNRSLLDFHVKVILFQDTTVVMELNGVGRDFSYWEKHEPSGCFKDSASCYSENVDCRGYWHSGDTTAINSFFELLKSKE